MNAPPFPLFIAWVALATCTLPCSAQPTGYQVSAPDIEVVAGRFKINITATVPLPCTKAWEVFTDFEAMSRFLPGLDTSRILSQTGDTSLIEQSGVVRYGVFSRRFASQRSVRMDPPMRVSSVSLKSADPDEPDLSSQTTFEPSAPGTRSTCVARYSAEAQPKGWIPASFASRAAGSIARAQMMAMMTELARRNP